MYLPCSEWHLSSKVSSPVSPEHAGERGVWKAGTSNLSLPSGISLRQPQLGTRALRPSRDACSDRSSAPGSQLSFSLPLRQWGLETNEVPSFKSPWPKVQKGKTLQEDTGRPQEGTSLHTQHSKNLQIETKK